MLTETDALNELDTDSLTTLDVLADTDTELEVDWLSNMEVLNDADFLADSLNDCDID